MVKKAKKEVMKLGETAFVASAASMGLSGLPSTGAGSSGLTGIVNATKFLPTTGTMVGAGMLMRTIKKLKK